MYDPDRITYFAETDYRNKRTRFGIKAEDRAKHVYVIGKTGMGKSTLHENMAVQDIQNGEGFAFIDPHGKTADLLLDYVPKERIEDVLYFAPFDMDNPVSFNVMEDVGPDKRHLVASGLMSAFKKIWFDAWSARMEYILNNGILALLEVPDTTLISINRMFVDKVYRKFVVRQVTDPAVKSFWEDEFTHFTDRLASDATAAIQNKVGQFVSNPIIRNIIGQSKSTFDLRDMMDNKKIVIINLSKGLVGEDNANLLGSMLITKIYLSAMSRADLSLKEMEMRPNFYLYVDEFQSFANESFADILSEARKYKLNLTMAHQYIEQMSDEVRAAVFGNVGTMITFRVGAFDADVLEKEFAPQFMAEDLVNLGRFQLYLKLMVDSVATPPFSATAMYPIAPPQISYKDVVIARSREQFGRKREEIEADIANWHQKSFAPKRSDISVGDDSSRDKKRPPSGDKKWIDNRRKDSATNKSGSEVRRERKSRSPQEREVALRKTMSLDHLKEQTKKSSDNKNRSKKKKTSKGPTEEHISQLKEALTFVLSTQQKKESSSKPVGIQRPVVVEKKHINNDRPEAVKRENNQRSKQKEVSEEKLKAMLGGDELSENKK